jgi:hypothetical protein
MKRSTPRFLRFALVSVAALLALLAVLKPAEARVVYTKVNQVYGSGQWSLSLTNTRTDFTFYQGSGVQGCLQVNVTIYPVQGDSVLYGTIQSGVAWAAALNAGAPINKNQSFFYPWSILADFRGGPVCPFRHDYGYWLNTGAHYLGLQITRHGKTHYGWAQLSVVLQQIWGGHYRLTSTLTGYAYESVVGKSILAGQTH